MSLDITDPGFYIPLTMIASVYKEKVSGCQQRRRCE